MTTASHDVDGDTIARSIWTPEDFAVVFDRYYVEIHRYVARRLGQDLADDISSETFLVAFARRGQYDQAHRDARPWLYGIASNLIARHYRAEQRRYRALGRAGSDDVSEGHDDRAVARLDAQALRRSLAEALSTISDGDRDVLLLVAWADLRAGRSVARHSGGDGSFPAAPGPPTPSVRHWERQAAMDASFRNNRRRIGVWRYE